MDKAKPFLVGISGGSGCGKTTILKALFEAMPEGSLALISQDDYYFPKEKQPKDHNGNENFDLPKSLNEEQFVQDLSALMDYKPLEIVEYTFNNRNKEGKIKVIQPAPIVIVEGLFVFHYKEIYQQMDYRVFVDAQEQTRFERRVIRDEQERGYPKEDVVYKWEHHVEPAYQEFLKPHKADCHMIIDNDDHFKEDLDKLVTLLKSKLSTNKIG